MMGVVVKTGAILCKAPVKHHHQQTNTQFFTGRMPFLSPNQQCQNTDGKRFADIRLRRTPGKLESCLGRDGAIR